MKDSASEIRACDASVASDTTARAGGGVEIRAEAVGACAVGGGDANTRAAGDRVGSGADSEGGVGVEAESADGVGVRAR